MDIIIPLSVSSCRECPYVTNSVQEHDDPFISTPSNNHWWCTNKDYRGPRILEDENKVPPECPFLSKET